MQVAAGGRRVVRSPRDPIIWQAVRELQRLRTAVFLYSSKVGINMSIVRHTSQSSAAGAYLASSTPRISCLEAAFHVTERGGSMPIESRITITGDDSYTQGLLSFTLSD